MLSFGVFLVFQQSFVGCWGGVVPFREQGCFDISYNTDSVFYFAKEFANLTPLHCHQACLQDGFGVAGLSGGNQCLCSDFVDRRAIQKGDQTRCSMPCVGDPTKMCGGIGVASVLTHTKFPNMEKHRLPDKTYTRHIPLAVYIPVALDGVQRTFDMYMQATSMENPILPSNADIQKQELPAYTYPADQSVRFVTSGRDALQALFSLKKYITSEEYDIYVQLYTGDQPKLEGEAISQNKALHVTTLLQREIESLPYTTQYSQYGTIQIIHYLEYTVVRQCKHCYVSMYHLVLPERMVFTQFPVSHAVSHIKRYLQVNRTEETPMDIITVQWKSETGDQYPLIGHVNTTQFCSYFHVQYLIQSDRECIGMGKPGVSALGFKQMFLPGIIVTSLPSTTSLTAVPKQPVFPYNYEGNVLDSLREQSVPLYKTFTEIYSVVTQASSTSSKCNTNQRRILSCDVTKMSPYPSVVERSSVNHVYTNQASLLAIHEDILLLYKIVTTASTRSNPFAFLQKVFQSIPAQYPYLAQYPVKPSLEITELTYDIQLQLNVKELVRPLYYHISVTLASLGKQLTRRDPDLARIVYILSHSLYIHEFPNIDVISLPLHTVVENIAVLKPYIHAVYMESVNTSQLVNIQNFALYTKPSNYATLNSLIPTLHGAHSITDMLLSMPKEDIHEVESRRDELIDYYAELAVNRAMLLFPSGGNSTVGTQYGNHVFGKKQQSAGFPNIFPPKELALMTHQPLYSLYELGYRDVHTNHAATRATATDWLGCAISANTALLFDTGYSRALYFSKQCQAYHAQAQKRLAASEEANTATTETTEAEQINQYMSSLYTLSNSSIISLSVLTITPILFIALRILLPLLTAKHSDKKKF